MPSISSRGIITKGLAQIISTPGPKLAAGSNASHANKEGLSLYAAAAAPVKQLGHELFLAV